jgi:hypothetical protein
VRELSEITESTSGGSEGAVRSGGRVSSSIGGETTYSLDRSLVTTIKIFFPYTCAEENIFCHNYNK